MYRSRPVGNLNSDALSFSSSMDDDVDLFFYDILGSQAHVIMLFESHILTQKEVVDILKGLNQLLSNPEQLNKHGINSSEDIHEMIESAIIKITGIDSGGKMHTARSRNDQVVLDIRMKLRDDINSICSEILRLVRSLVRVAEANVDTIMPMYTHLQQAQLGVLSQYMLSYCYSLIRNFERYYDAFTRINFSPLGACAIGGSSMDIDREKVATMLGFSGIIYNSVDATSSRDFLIEFISICLTTMLDLCRMSEDFILWSTSEFGFIILDDKYSSSSSAMPQKKNPDPLELIRGKTATIQGNLVSISSIMKGLPSGYSRDLQELKPLLWKTSSTLRNSIKIMEGVVSTLFVDKKAAYNSSSKSYAIALDIAEQLIKEGNISFRVAHKVIGALVESASGRGNIPMNTLSVDDIAVVLKKIDFSHPILTSEKIYRTVQSITPENSIKLRHTKGSPNKNEQFFMITHLKNVLYRYENNLEHRIEGLNKMQKSLIDRIKYLIDQEYP